MRTVVLALIALNTLAWSQSLPPGMSLVRTYSNPLGIIGSMGGLEFSADGMTLYAGAFANNTNASVMAMAVIRDLNGQITGLGPPSVYAVAPRIDGGLQFGPAGTLFWTTYNNHQLGQYPVGGPSVDFPLSGTGIPSSTGSLEFVPSNLPNGGDLLVASYNTGDIYTVPLTPNGNGTFTPGTATLFATLPAGTEGMRHIPSGPSAGSMAIVNFGLGNISLMRINLATGMPLLLANGQPDISPFITGIPGAEGLAFDPLTNDFFVGTFGNPTQIFHFTGLPGQFPVVAPATYSVSSGAPIVLPIDMGTSYAGAFYLLVVGDGGNAPGVPWINLVVPLNPTPLTFAVLDLVNMGSPVFQNFTGNLSSLGQAVATFDPMGPLPPFWAGVNIDFCLLASPPEFASLPAAVAFIP